MAGEISYTLTGEPVLSGGTRSAVTGRMVDRPWQPPKPGRMKNCPFCVENGQMRKKVASGAVKEFYPAGATIDRYFAARMANEMTPHRYHELLLPAHDEPVFPWDNQRVLTGLLDIAFERIETISETDPETTNVQIGFHYGQLGGQNFSHPHWHIIGSCYPIPAPCMFCHWREKKEFVFAEHENLVALLDGVRAGQVIITSRCHSWDWKLGIQEISEMLFSVASLFKARFDDPDFIITTALQRNGHFWLEYTPILNNLGCTEMLAIRGLYPYTQPCSPEKMLEYLQTGER